MTFFFTRPLATEVEPELPPPSARAVAESRYREVLVSLNAAKEEMGVTGLAIQEYKKRHGDLRTKTLAGRTFVAVGAMTAEPELRKLEAHMEYVTQRFWSLLKEAAQLNEERKLTEER